MDSARGQLLIAGPALVDPNFWRTVVLVVQHNDEGALGLVLNRPADTTIGESVPVLDELVDSDEPLFIGGPVQPSSVMVLAEFEDVGVLGTAATLDRPIPGVRSARAFAGHAGWGPQQLDGEIERGDWILESATLADAFSAEPRGLWSEVLTRKGGSYALIARMPPDPSMN